MFKYHFGKMAKAPFYYTVLRHLGSISDGITGLVMMWFGYYGTSFNVYMCEKTLRWQMNNRKKQKGK